MDISLTLPKAKKYLPGFVQVKPFPVTEIGDRPRFVGIFTGMSVEVFDANDIRELYECGCYGSGALTKVEPKLVALGPSKNPSFGTRSQYNAKKELEEKFGNQNPNEITLKILLDDCEQKTKRGDDFGRINEGETNFIEETDPFPLEESLVLSMEEAFFLHHSLRCLKIVDFEQNSELSTEDFLRNCCALKKNFILHFIAYHYYRSQGWIVKNGLKFGGDFRKWNHNRSMKRVSF